MKGLGPQPLRRKGGSVEFQKNLKRNNLRHNSSKYVFRVRNAVDGVYDEYQLAHALDDSSLEHTQVALGKISEEESLRSVEETPPDNLKNPFMETEGRDSGQVLDNNMLDN